MTAPGESDNTPKSDQNQRQTELSILYQRPFRRPAIVSLVLVEIWNTVIFIFACVVSHSIPRSNNLPWRPYEYGARFHDLTSLGVRTVIFLFWGTIPLVIWLNSSLELYKRWRCTLKPVHIVATCSISIALWLLEAGMWAPCVLSSYWTGYFDPISAQPWHCPFPKGPSWYFTATPLAPPRAYYVLIWFIIPAVVLHGVYLTLAGVALSRDRNAQRLDSALRKIDCREAAIEKRYKITSSVYTDVNTISDAFPSTLHSSFRTPESSTPPISPPPSYGGLSSNRSSVRSDDTSRGTRSH